MLLVLLNVTQFVFACLGPCGKWTLVTWWCKDEECGLCDVGVLSVFPVSHEVSLVQLVSGFLVCMMLCVPAVYLPPMNTHPNTSVCLVFLYLEVASLGSHCSVHQSLHYFICSYYVLLVGLECPALHETSPPWSFKSEQVTVVCFLTSFLLNDCQVLWTDQLTSFVIHSLSIKSVKKP